MSIATREHLQEEIVSILKRYSGTKSIGLDEMIGREVGLNGMDGVEILYELEERFNVDLNPLIEAHTMYSPPSWFGRLLGREHGRPYADLTVRELIDYIASQGQRSGQRPPD